MYAKIINNCISKYSKVKKEGYSYLPLDYNSFVKLKAQDFYVLGSNGVLLKENKPIIKVKSKEIKENIEIPEHNTVNLQLQKVKEQFEKATDMNIKWKNGHYYKSRYASENYEPLLAANKILELETQGQKSLFPKEIWDATKLNSDIMSAQELQELALFLAKIYEKQFQQYKRQYAKILESNK